MRKKLKNIIVLCLTVCCVCSISVLPVFANTVSQLVSEFKNPPKGKSTTSLAGEIAKLTPANRDEVYLLLNLLKEQKGNVREDLTKSIGNISNPALGPIFVKELNNSHPIIRAVSAAMCGKLKLVETEKDLIKLIKDFSTIVQFPDTDEERATVTAVLALGELRQESSIDFLVSLLGTMKGYEVQALRKFGIKSLKPLLAKMNDPNSSGNTRMAAVQVLMAMEDEAAAPLLEKEAADREKSKARPYAITVLLKLNPDKYLPRFIAEWEKDPDLILEARLLYYINNWRLGDARQLPFLIKVLQNSPQPEYRVMAVTGLARIKSDESWAALKKAAADKDKKVSMYAAQALQMYKK